MGNKIIEGLSAFTSSYEEVLPDIVVLHFTVSTACIVGTSARWMLVDTGLENSADFILSVAQSRFGRQTKPTAIVLTHGHFDHVGSVITLADKWNVPVYVHPFEMPYVTGKRDYPKADPSVDPGLVAKLSPLFPHTSIDIGDRAVPLPEDGTIPSMPEWRWIATPGHTEGHISLFREKDRVLIVGDAFSTTKQESLLSVLTQKEQISGPPKYLTTNWSAAEKSIQVLRDLSPKIAIPSHGKPMKGSELFIHLNELVMDFSRLGRPQQGRYVTGDH